MCGIFFNYSLQEGGITSKGTKCLYNMALTSQVRGVDGTGLFFADNEGKNLKFFKEAVPASMFLDDSQWNKMVGDARFVVGHVRAATQGKLTDEDTHPFVFDNVVGVHNGTIHLWDTLDVMQGVTASMDSSAVYTALDALDPDEASVGKFLGGIESGAYALVWYDKRVNELRIARNSERPLHVAFTGEDIWGASELGMLEWVLNRNSYAISSAFEVDTHTLLSIPTDGRPARFHDYYNDIEITSVVGTSSYGGSSYKSYNSWDNGWNDPWDDDVPFAQQTHRPYYEDWRGRGGNGVVPAEIPSNVLVTAITQGMRWPHIERVKEEVRVKVQHAITELVGPIESKSHYISLYDHLATALADKVAGSYSVPNVPATVFPLHVVKLDEYGTPYGYVIVDGVMKAVSIPTVWTRSCSPTSGVLKLEDLLDKGKEAIVTVGKLTSVRAYHQGEVCFRGIIPYNLAEHEVTEGMDLLSEEGREVVDEFYNNHPDINEFMEGDTDWDRGWASYEMPEVTDEGVY